MPHIVRILDRDRWVYLNVDQVVRLYQHASQGLWVVDTAEGDGSAHHYLNDEYAALVLAAMGWTEPERP
jgi:hypothetical protein